MKIKTSHIIILVLLLLLVVSNIWRKPIIETKIVTTTDTIIRYTYDTIRIVKPKIVQTIIRDTIVVKIADDNNINLIYSNKIYRDSLYEAYVSGYNANLDSINVYNKIITKNIITNIEKTIYKERWDLYFDCGVNKINNYVSPNIGLTLSMPNGFKLGGEMGLYDNKVYYGFKIGYRIK